ncbi:phosphoenolpyruvate synthase [Candidatus Micrarchaeota archaeon]|nr:phosphoenolpyruvate synthase [Candidatus Micrarchaeota archaeon]MBU1930238.1 phosphoenolpyruvate synthase [Candidatus Micrarchaeota archaeon]
MSKKDAIILWFDQIDLNDIAIVGGKNASLGEMYRFLTPTGIRVPNGFCVTAHAYHVFLEKTGLHKKIQSELKGLNTKNFSQLAEKGKKIREMILHATIPSEIREPIITAYQKLGLQYGKNPDVAVRSSATAEDLPEASFAGQQESYLNIQEKEPLLEACQKCFASLFTNRAISYRQDKGFGLFSVALSIGVQKMVRSDLASSGVLFTLDTETGFENAIIINASYGLGESIVKGIVNPDQFILFKPILEKRKNALLSKKKGEKRTKIVYAQGEKQSTKSVPVSSQEQKQYCISEQEALQLGQWGLEIEKYYSKKAGHRKPMDIEWAKDGKTNQLFIVQARPETVQSQRPKNLLESYILKKKGNVLATGQSIGEKIGIGKAHIIKNVNQISTFQKGEVLVTDTTDPDWEPIMKLAAAIVTNRGGRTSHSAIVSRELGIPAIVGCNNATETIPNGKKITVSCCEGSTGKIYEGTLPFEKKVVDLKTIPKTHTKVMINLADPSRAFEYSFLPCDGIGLAREEFIISDHIRIHPLALIHFDILKDVAAKKRITELTAGYQDKKQFFVDKLAEGIALLGAAFYPKQVIVRFSDFKSNEYANLIGGKEFEPIEENPMLGWRGASRYYSKKFQGAFALECQAIRMVREEKGLENVQVMVPFCRTVEEGKKVLQEMKKNGLVQGQNGLIVFVMCEVPSNVILAHEFAQIFDGFSIGTNDLTQLTLGLDRDSELVAGLYDERNAAVKRLVQQVIQRSKQHKRKIGICGQAPSDFPDFAAFLVQEGIDSISLNPDSVLKTKLIIALEEKKLMHWKKKL